MRAATSVALIALLAAPVFASPASSAPIEEEPSISTQIISSAAGGAASGAVGNLLSKIENLFRRDVGGRSAGTLTSIVKQAQTLSAADKATVKTALVNKISTLQAPSKRLSVGDAAGKALGGLASEGAKTAVGGLLTDIENLFRRDEPKLDARAGLGGAIASSVAGGAASGLVGNLLGELESFLKRDDLGELGAFDDPEDLPDFNNFGIPDPIPAGDNGLFGVSIIARAGLGGAIASSVAGGAASGLVGNLLGEVCLPFPCCSIRSRL
ncbi:hypothetical protein DL93DRAFT_1387371 [Clavulina sp. PMI_390]|nr:hypothetical protein DL93DRAFT_1387371 [Clavulina sp. PMI_390]